MRPHVIATGIAVIDARTADCPRLTVRRAAGSAPMHSPPGQPVPRWRPALQSTEGG
jgi:hypothetical protein